MVVNIFIEISLLRLMYNKFDVYRWWIKIPNSSGRHLRRESSSAKPYTRPRVSWVVLYVAGNLRFSPTVISRPPPRYRWAEKWRKLRIFRTTSRNIISSVFKVMLVRFRFHAGSIFRTKIKNRDQNAKTRFKNILRHLGIYPRCLEIYHLAISSSRLALNFLFCDENDKNVSRKSYMRIVNG